MKPRDRRKAKATETTHVSRPPAQAFDYTQDYATRADRDGAVRDARVINESPRRERSVRARRGKSALIWQTGRSSR